MTRSRVGHHRGAGRVQPGQRRDRGAVFVEMALVLPLLFALFMGIFEFSEGWESNLKVQSATRGAGRSGSSLGADRKADYFMLQTLKAGLTTFPVADVQRIVIYKASAANGAPPAACLTGFSGTAGCNVYTGAQMNTLTPANFTGACTVDANWCPRTRNDSQGSADYLGVHVEVLHRYTSNFFPGSGITVRQGVVMRIEPRIT